MVVYTRMYESMKCLQHTILLDEPVDDDVKIYLSLMSSETEELLISISYITRNTHPVIDFSIMIWLPIQSLL